MDSKQDERLARLAELLKDEQENPSSGAVSPMPIKVKGAGNTINVGGTQVNLAASSTPDFLSPDQRRRLNRLVTEISTDYQADPRILWREVVHTRIGVSSIDEILRSQFTEAEQALLDHAEQLRAHNHARRLVAEVLRIANERGIYQEMTRYVGREFGGTVLNKLNPEQLKETLRFVEGYQLAAAEPTPAPVPTRLKYLQRMVRLVIEHPAHMGAVLVIGFVIGKAI